MAGVKLLPLSLSLSLSLFPLPSSPPPFVQLISSDQSATDFRCPKRLLIYPNNTKQETKPVSGTSVFGKALIEIHQSDALL